jgi:hypothetical protein
MPTHNIFRGDTRIFRSTVVDQNRDPIDITGWTFLLSASKKAGTTPPNIQVAGSIINAASGIVEFELSPAETAIVGTYYYDVEATTNKSKIHTIDSGQLVVVQDITVPPIEPEGE